MNLNRTIIQQGVPKRPSPKSAFTFVELLVTMVMAALLALSIRPGIANTKTNAKVARCQNNLRQFTVGWSMYAADYGDRVPNNFGPEDIISAIQSKRLDNWANNVMTWGMGPGLSDASNTNRTWIGLLGQYVASNDNIYHCPSDNYLSSAQVAARFSHRVRSISMNAVFGRYSIGADETASGKNALLPEYMQYLKQSHVRKPAKTWLVIEEHPDSINDGLFINSPNATSWADIPAVFHHGGTSLSFADGHTELKHWRSPNMIPQRVIYSYPSPRTFDTTGRADYQWYLSRTGWVEVSSGRAMFGY